MRITLEDNYNADNKLRLRAYDVSSLHNDVLPSMTFPTHGSDWDDAANSYDSLNTHVQTCFNGYRTGIWMGGIHCRDVADLYFEAEHRTWETVYQYYHDPLHYQEPVKPPNAGVQDSELSEACPEMIDLEFASTMALDMSEDYPFDSLAELDNAMATLNISLGFAYSCPSLVAVGIWGNIIADLTGFKEKIAHSRIRPKDLHILGARWERISTALGSTTSSIIAIMSPGLDSWEDSFSGTLKLRITEMATEIDAARSGCRIVSNILEGFARTFDAAYRDAANNVFLCNSLVNSALSLAESRGAAEGADFSADFLHILQKLSEEVRGLNSAADKLATTIRLVTFDDVYINFQTTNSDRVTTTTVPPLR